jgi:hypothetical protein
MTSFKTILDSETVGKLCTFDRMIFHGHLTGFFPRDAFGRFLSSQGVLLKDFGRYVERTTRKLKTHIESVAAEHGRPMEYLQSAFTVANGMSKEDLARRIAERDKIKEGLICVFSTLEPAWSFDVRGNRKTHKLEVVRRERRYLHFYFYLIDPRFGFMHVRIGSWFPFQVQVYINGREWLAKSLDKAGIGYRRHDNTFTQIDNVAKARALAEKFGHHAWPRFLDTLARRINPLLPLLGKAGFGSYYWCLDQCEVATDIMFKSRTALASILPELNAHAILHFSAEDVLRFLGRKLHPLFQGEVTSDTKRRPEGVRIKHRVKRNSIKMYDKASVLRIETTINNPREFKVLRTMVSRHGRSRRWVPMGKGVANARRMLQLGEQSNQRYLEALANVEFKREAIDILDHLCRPHKKDGRHVARLNPITKDECAIFRAAMAGEHAIAGFRNHDLTARLYPNATNTPEESKRICARVSRKIRTLRDHGLVAKVPGSRLYRVSRKGYQVMAAALRFRNLDFPTLYNAAA